MHHGERGGFAHIHSHWPVLWIMLRDETRCIYLSREREPSELDGQCFAMPLHPCQDIERVWTSEIDDHFLGTESEIKSNLDFLGFGFLSQ